MALDAANSGGVNGAAAWRRPGNYTSCRNSTRSGSLSPRCKTGSHQDCGSEAHKNPARKLLSLRLEFGQAHWPAQAQLLPSESVAMSEYQYYEFAAMDGPISDAGLRYARSCSSRANVSRVRWQNTYTFGDFHGSVDTLLKYYDAHFYIANWGTVRLGLAFPNGVIAPEAIQPYLRGGERYEETLTVKEIGDRCVVWWERNEEGGGGWTEGDGRIDQLIGVREELMCGDYRALFLGWLAPKTAPFCSASSPQQGPTSLDNPGFETSLWKSKDGDEKSP
jgi:hypothetical protein